VISKRSEVLPVYHDVLLKVKCIQKRKPWPETGVKEPGLPMVYELLGGEQHRILL